jgi:hypothetical protein
MKGIYLTEEGKKELETEIAELARTYREYGCWEEKYGELQTLRKILSSAIVLPVEESWERLSLKVVGSTHAVPSAIVEKFENGLIIQPK